MLDKPQSALPNQAVTGYPLSDIGVVIRNTPLLLVLLFGPSLLSPQKATTMAPKLPAQLSFHFNFNVTKEHVPTENPYNSLTSVRHLPEKQHSEVQSNSPALLEPQTLPLEWLLGQKDATLAQVERARKSLSADLMSTRVLARLQQAEAHEVNAHLKADYRQAWITLSFAIQNIPSPFVAASYEMYGLHPDKVWPAIVADRKAKLGREYYDFYDSEDNLRSDVPKIPPTRDVEPNERLQALMNFTAEKGKAANE